MNYFICGFSGAGKSHLLKKIEQMGKYQGFKYLDLDDEIFSVHNVENCKNLGELIESKGFPWFRKVEQELLKDLLERDNHWIALGGGTLNDDLISYLAERSDVKGFWLDTDFETCWNRISLDTSRPLTKEGKDLMQERFSERSEHYRLFEIFNFNNL